MDIKALEVMSDLELVFMRHEMVKVNEPKENIRTVNLEIAKRHKKNSARVRDARKSKTSQ